MANEITHQNNVVINAGNLQFNFSKSFSSDMTGRRGPTPGSIVVQRLGTDVDLSQLTKPGLCVLINQDTVNTIEYGILDTETNKFIPWGELGPGRQTEFQFSREFRADYIGTGTGTSAYTNKLRIRHFGAVGTTAQVFVGAFDR